VKSVLGEFSCGVSICPNKGPHSDLGTPFYQGSPVGCCGGLFLRLCAQDHCSESGQFLDLGRHPDGFSKQASSVINSFFLRFHVRGSKDYMEVPCWLRQNKHFLNLILINSFGMVTIVHLGFEKFNAA